MIGQREVVHSAGARPISLTSIVKQRCGAKPQAPPIRWHKATDRGC